MSSPPRIINKIQLVTLLIFCLPFLTLAENGTLENAKIRLAFDAHGLTSYQDKSLERGWTIVEDGFKIEIDGKVYSPGNLISGGWEWQEGMAIHNFHSDQFRFSLQYELQPDWGFVSKQLFVESISENPYRVTEIGVLNLTLEEEPSSEFIPKTRRPEFFTADYGAFLRFADDKGLYVLVQNPFLHYNRDGGKLTLPYNADMPWENSYGPYATDRACIGSYALSGNGVPATMIPEWKWTAGQLPLAEDAQDWAEIEAFTSCVEAFILPHPQESLNMHAGWCGNDYQIDIATEAGRTEYKRIIDQAADLGMDYILFAPTNSELGSREDTKDDWNWENLLWLGMGIQIRKGEWDPETDELPASVQEMLDYAKARDIRLVSYMYPVMPFAGNEEWIVRDTPYHGKKHNASLGVRSFQDFLIENLSTFYERFGLGGYAYDYTFMWYEGSSRYEQWWGWKRVKDELKTKHPDLLLDGRQLDMVYGPWIWVSGSYPHPSGTDEQPESFTPFPDLHFDRASANRQRYTAYRYRVNDYCPADIMPGFIGHQTSRKDGDSPDNWSEATPEEKPVMRLDRFRARDWDYLGWKFSLISSIATGGLNNIVSMIPARDEEEYKYFAEEDKAFFRHWLDWTDENREYLLNTRFIIGQPAIGRVDGTSALVEDEGYIFLFNPNGRQLDAEFSLDASIGLMSGQNFLLKEIYPREQFLGQHENGIWSFGEQVSIPLDGASSRVLKLIPVEQGPEKAKLLNLPGTATLKWGTLVLNDLSVEVGSRVEAMVLMPKGKKIRRVKVDGQKTPFTQEGSIVRISIESSGNYFPHMKQVLPFDPQFSGGQLTGSLVIPRRIKDQLASRKKAWPIAWEEEDYKTPYLAPERLLLFVQMAEPQEEMSLSLSIDGEEHELVSAWSSVRRHERCFLGWYCDISNLEPEKEYKISLNLPELEPGQFQGLFVENIETEYTLVTQ
ncbi:MAG: hypothetical protein HOB84_10430 [Candidatus Marinimicrobia bacterium]|nr:hypothetical protein [Candidatus Neomarinimicrobiota bacterium]MBT4361238.1 hypothetical protein [Candidatus Neomarinimicrobiota bacterium]MBT4715177.1 hypothetical protein [Candidatus Neomarinimicrobiota bacterium]MBT4947351.1 hypothetical protein [Candidatus Neomarinimicrobiota bacterium]MBT5271460.1 hypothetical protein [Candidatus Neomarinimicrobiota bacterium]